MLNLVRDSEIDKTVTNIAQRGMKIFCVPVGGANTDVGSLILLLLQLRSSDLFKLF